VKKDTLKAGIETDAWSLIPVEHRRPARGAAVGAAIGAVIGSVFGGPVGAVIGASILGGVGASVTQ
jgi:uncharacterized protein YcfJ